MELTSDELDLCRQWFNAVLDVTPEYLQQDDYRLAAEIHLALGARVPNSVLDGAKEPVVRDTQEAKWT